MKYNMHVMKDTEQNLTWLLVRSSIPAKQGLVKMSEKKDMPMMQLITLCLLDEDEAIPMNTITKYLGCDASNLTGIVDRLVAGNYIERKESPKDRRVKMISLTPAGSEIKNHTMQKLVSTKLDMMSKLSEDEIVTLKSLLAKIVV